MAANFQITCDSTADLSWKVYNENDVHIVPFSYTLGADTYAGSEDDDLPMEEFYRRMRAGEMANTSQVTNFTYQEHFKKYIDAGTNVLHIAFSSALSGSCAAAKQAADELNEASSGAKVYHIDSKAASGGQGLYLHRAIELRNEGRTASEAQMILEKEKLTFCHYFTVDDLNFLYRGGRVSKASATFGTMLNIKPLLHVDDEGRLINIGKVRGRKQSLTWLVESMKKLMPGHEQPIVYINHADCREEAEFVADLVRKECKIKNIEIYYIGNVIGSHTGPGCMALFFMGGPKR